MDLTMKIRLVYHAFRNTQDKKALLKNTWKKYKQGGIAAVKASIVTKNGTSSDAREELYRKQLKEERRNYEQYPESLLFIVIGEGDNKEKNITYKTISEQMKQQDEILFSKSLYDRYRAAKNSGMDYVFFIKDGDYIAPYMRDEFAAGMHKGAELVYSDEAVFDEQNGCFVRHYIKPEYSFFDEIEYDVLQRAVIFKVSELNKINLDDDTINHQHCFESDLLSLIVRASHDADSVLHISRILLLRRNDSTSEAELMRVNTIRVELSRLGISGSIVKTENGWKIGNIVNALTTNIIIAANDAEAAFRCIESITEHTEFLMYIITVVGTASILTALADKVGYPIKCIECNEEDSLTHKYNLAAEKSNADYLVFISEDQITVDDWLLRLYSAISILGISAVSPKVLRTDRTIRYAGMIAGGFGFTAIPFNGNPDILEVNKNAPAFVNRLVSVLSASCMMVRKIDFDKAGGFKETIFRGKFSNAQLSFDIQRNGGKCAYCSDAEIISGGQDWYDSLYDKEDGDAYLNLLKYYGSELSNDPWFSNDMKYQYLYGVPIDFKIYSPGENSHE